MEKALTLYELNSLVAELINTAMPQSYWVEAEVSEADKHHPLLKDVKPLRKEDL